MDTPEISLFEAVIVPHRSLSRRGTLILVGAMCSLGLAVTVVFLMLGAWPVAGFDVIDVALAVLLLRMNGRARRSSETLTLTDGALHIVRRDADGRETRRSLAPGWLNAVLEERPGRVPALWLVARGAREEVGAALGEAEKRDLAAALRAGPAPKPQPGVRQRAAPRRRAGPGRGRAWHGARGEARAAGRGGAGWRGALGGCCGRPAEARQASEFFFEKKNQKTLPTSVFRHWEAWT